MLHNPEIVKMAEAGWWVVFLLHYLSIHLYIYLSIYLNFYLSLYIEAITIEMFKMENLQGIELNGELK